MGRTRPKHLGVVALIVLLSAGVSGWAGSTRAQPPEGADGLSAPRAPVVDPRFAGEFPPLEPAATAAAYVEPTAAEPDGAQVLDVDADLPRDPSPFHVGLDVAWQRAQLRFVTPMEYAVAGCGCGMDTVSADLIRTSLSVGWAGLSLEGSFARSIRTPESFDQWSAGVRLDTSYRAALSFAIRAAYLRRTGAIGGEGGRGALALQIRLIRQLVFYAEGGVDVTNVPQNEATVLSYSFYYSAGMRVVLGR